MTEQTNPQKKIRKRFFSSQKECAWLNDRGAEGLLLLFRSENSYVFEQTEEHWFYSVEWLDCSPESDRGEELINARTADGCTLVATYSLWAYFASKEAIEPTADSRMRTAHRYRNTALLLFAADAVAAILTAYHFAIRTFLEAQAIFLEAPVMEPASNFIVNLARRLIYGGELILYRYSKFCSNFFGDTKATAALSVLVPLTVILAVLGAMWTNEWLKNLPPKTQKEEPEHDASAQASGETADDC